DPDTMPFTRFANTAIDRVAPRREDIISEIVEYAGSDLLCYRANEPRELISRHVEHWDPLLDWAKEALGAQFETIQGVVHKEQQAETMSAIRKSAEAHGAFALTGLHNIMTMTGSAIMALAVVRQAISGMVAWQVAHVDEDWQIEQWGEDAEAEARRALRHDEFMATVKFLELV
ncbi:MAG: ATP12 family chaperone protein, partial [Hyphomicrobiales bacterium]